MVSTIKVSTCTVFTVHTMPLEINKDRKTRMSLTHSVRLTTNCSHCLIALGFCTRVQYSQCHLKQQESKNKNFSYTPCKFNNKLHCTLCLIALGFCTRVQYSQCHLKQQESKNKNFRYTGTLSIQQPNYTAPTHCLSAWFLRVQYLQCY